MTTHKRLNRSMFVKIEKPLSGQEPTKWHFLIHGLMDSHLGWEAVTQKALENGEGVIRVDLHGHARTLAKDYQAGMKLLDTRDNYRLNVSDVIQVLKRLRHDYGIRRPQVTGHSYGGGIATSIATHPFGKNLIDSKLTVIAPYVYRIDGYKAENTIFYMGGLPFLRVMQSFITDRFKARIEAFTTDPLTDVFMTKMYTKHFKKLLNQRVPELSEVSIRKIKDSSQRHERRQTRNFVIEKHVEAAIKITKGIRSFDGRDVVDDLPSQIDFQLILGENDQLVPREMEVEFFNLLVDRGLNARLIEVEGAGHMVINEEPQEIFDNL
jgi:pimeloyl-ACP methyl ester carboxylesterase